MAEKNKSQKKKIQKVSFVKSKSGPQLGYRTPDHFKGSKFSGGKRKDIGPKFNPAQFKTQHKG